MIHGRFTHCAFYHWRPHLFSDCCIGLEQSAGVGPVVSVVASFPQQTENRTFCLVLQSWLTTSHCTDYYYVTSLLETMNRGRTTAHSIEICRLLLYTIVRRARTSAQTSGLLLRVLVVLGLNATLKLIRPSSSSSYDSCKILRQQCTIYWQSMCIISVKSAETSTGNSYSSFCKATTNTSVSDLCEWRTCNCCFGATSQKPL